jgi:hypothetical protein
MSLFITCLRPDSVHIDPPNFPKPLTYKKARRIPPPCNRNSFELLVVHFSYSDNGAKEDRFALLVGV